MDVKVFILNNWDAIIDAIAILAFLISFGSLVYTAIRNRCKMKINISLVREMTELNDSGYLFYLAIENLSRLQVAISSIRIILEGQMYPCSPVPQKAFVYDDGKGNYRIFESLAMPVVIPGLGGANGFFVFFDCPHNIQEPPSEVTFVVNTNRKQSLKLKCLLHDQAYREDIFV